MTKIPSFETLLKRFISAVETQKNTDFGDRNAVRRYNAATERFIKISRQISEIYPERIDEFSLLLENDDVELQTACACMMIQFMDCTEEQLCRAYKCIIEYCCKYAHGADKMAYEVMFERFPPKSKEILDMVKEKNPFYAEPIDIEELRKHLNSLYGNNHQ